MPVYNGEQYIDSAIESILKQSFKDFEFLIIDDCSTDASVKAIQTYTDSRIRLYSNKENLGIAATLNNGISLARGQYIARMDCDDISRLKRFAKQVSFLEKHTDIGVCGSWISTFGKNKLETLTYPVSPNEINCSLLFRSPLAHPSVMMRKEIFIQGHFAYNEELKYVEDYQLWCQLVKNGIRLANIREVLLDYRCHPRPYQAIQYENAGQIRLNLLEELDIFPSREEFMIHEALSNCKYSCDRSFISQSQSWLSRIVRANQALMHYHPNALYKLISEKWLDINWNCSRLGLTTWKKYHSQNPDVFLNVNLLQKSKFLVKCLLKR